MSLLISLKSSRPFRNLEIRFRVALKTFPQFRNTKSGDLETFSQFRNMTSALPETFPQFRNIKAGKHEIVSHFRNAQPGRLNIALQFCVTLSGGVENPSQLRHTVFGKAETFRQKKMPPVCLQMASSQYSLLVSRTISL